MAKVSGSYESVIRGVSEQVSQDRRSGQHHAQLNMISDPVRGLARRHGSILQDEAAIPAGDSLATLLDDTEYHRVNSFWIDGVEYDLIFRTTGAVAQKSAFAFAFNREANRFIPVVLGTDANLTLLASGGVSAVANIGRYLYIAGNSITPAYTTTDLQGDASNRRRAVVWVRGGAFSRTFKVTVTKPDGSKVTAQYKTVSSSYPGTLNTSDIPSTATDYQKQVNDRVYAYNTAVTQWIGTSAEDITPENIAEKLRAAINSAGITGSTRQGGTVLIDNANVDSIQTEDGGDGNLLRGVANEVVNPELVSTIHYVGKVVKVKPSKAKGDDALYVKAYAKDEKSTGWTDVHWRECAGKVFQPTTVFAMATIVNDTLYIAGGPTELSDLTDIEVPGYQPNDVGDDLSCPIPSFFGKTITYLGMFQDRLVVGCGATIFVSRPGDYLNFWRQSVLTILADDPWEGYALGAEDDIIKWATTWNRDLYLYGRRFQYMISGRGPLTPQTASIVASSAYKDATDAPPVNNGNYVFYAKRSADEDGTYKTSLHQVGAGQVVDSPESSEVSQQLDTFIQGRPVEIVANMAPNLVVLRTDADRRTLYTYSYLDTADGGERLTDSWSKWTWAEPVGNIIGASMDKGNVLVYLLRERDGICYVAAERFSLNSKLSGLPYADSLQRLSDANANPAMADAPGAIVALANDGGTHSLMGTDYSNLTTFNDLYPTELDRAWVGFPSDAYVTPTNPYMRDQAGSAVLDGRLTLSQVKVTVADTGGLEGIVTTSSGSRKMLDFNGRVLGSKSFLMGEQPIASTTLPLTVGKEVRECQYTLKAKTWLPLTITNLSWTGQVFNNTRRV